MDENKIMEEYLKLQEVLKEKEQEIETYKANEEKFTEERNTFTSTVAELRDTNMKLFLKVSQVEEHSEPEQSNIIEEKADVSLDSILSCF